MTGEEKEVCEFLHLIAVSAFHLFAYSTPTTYNIKAQSVHPEYIYMYVCVYMLLFWVVWWVRSFLARMCAWLCWFVFVRAMVHTYDVRSNFFNKTSYCCGGVQCVQTRQKRYWRNPGSWRTSTSGPINFVLCYIFSIVTPSQFNSALLIEWGLYRSTPELLPSSNVVINDFGVRLVLCCSLYILLVYYLYNMYIYFHKFIHFWFFFYFIVVPI